MKMRKKIDYEDIVKIGIARIKEETDFLWECTDDSDKAKSAYVISGIVDVLDRLNNSTIMSQDEIDKAMFHNAEV